MTTELAAKLYEIEHVRQHRGRPVAIYNPNDIEINDLPVIYGFNNGGEPGWMEATLLAEDGTYLGGHICSSETYMPHDLGILEGTRPDRHESFRVHYPQGYRMEFVCAADVKSHAGLMRAYELNQQQREQQQCAT